ncbi:MAG: chorismate lyase/3-hydroxybenzoate synthase [Arenicella sp.]|jgi:chorismate lyase/3-hydroxybenzoate synthase
MLSNNYSTQKPSLLLAQPDTLAVLEFSNTATAPRVPLLLDMLDEHDNLVEVWAAPGETVLHGSSDKCNWSRSEHYQFVSMSLPNVSAQDLNTSSQEIYRLILKTIDASDYPHLVRFWNIIPFINRGDGDGENYKKFCAGRLSAFEEFNVGDMQFPAASAVGHYGAGITVYCLSTKHDPTNIANPRQINAYSYPRQYGRSSPSFARATTLSTVDKSRPNMCFISGTASILGHSSVHIGDLQGQLHTTNDNILYLLKETGFKQTDIKSARVYLRDPADLLEARSTIKAWYPEAELVFTHADICRDDLLIEIECFCST